MIEMSATTVREALLNLDAQHPGLKQELLDEADQVKSHMQIFVNDWNIRYGDGLDTELKDSDEIWILPAMAGGIR